jgi:hypothetical protein
LLPGQPGGGGPSGPPSGVGPGGAPDQVGQPASLGPPGPQGQPAPGQGPAGQPGGSSLAGLPALPGQAAGVAAPGAARTDASAGRDESGDPPITRNPLLAPLPGRRPRTTPLGLLIGNRDWAIAVECKRDEVIVPATGLHFPVAVLEQAATVQNPLLDGVRALIDRRQAAVQPGEPPYRPVLRFRVHPGGLRAYYAANALLVPLRLPATRVNVEAAPP